MVMADPTLLIQLTALVALVLLADRPDRDARTRSVERAAKPIRTRGSSRWQ